MLPVLFHSSTGTTALFVLKNPVRNIKWLPMEFLIKEGNWDANRALGITREPTCFASCLWGRKSNIDTSEKHFAREFLKNQHPEIRNMFIFLKKDSIISVQMLPKIIKVTFFFFWKYVNLFDLETNIWDLQFRVVTRFLMKTFGKTWLCVLFLWTTEFLHLAAEVHTLKINNVLHQWPRRPPTSGHWPLWSKISVQKLFPFQVLCPLTPSVPHSKWAAAPLVLDVHFTGVSESLGTSYFAPLPFQSSLFFRQLSSLTFSYSTPLLSPSIPIVVATPNTTLFPST